MLPLLIAMEEKNILKVYNTIFICFFFLCDFYVSGLYFKPISSTVLISTFSFSVWMDSFGCFFPSTFWGPTGNCVQYSGKTGL